MTKIVFITAVFLFAQTAFAAEIFVSPEKFLQGDPLMVIVKGANISEVKEITFDGKRIRHFLWRGETRALAGIDLYKKAGNYQIKVVLSDGSELLTTIAVLPRKKVSVSFGIPAKLGGNTPVSQQKLVSTLADENWALAQVPSGDVFLPIDSFRYPVKEVLVTDVYGYSRKTGDYSIAHKGVDFSAKEGTRVYAMNDGVVRFVRTLRNYGKSLVIDHGLGVQTVYLHLSQTFSKEGQEVKKGERVALSGSSGYAFGAHLHVSVKIGGVSVDPMKFLELFE